jgi:hypothetical protein
MTSTSRGVKRFQSSVTNSPMSATPNPMSADAAAVATMVHCENRLSTPPDGAGVDSSSDPHRWHVVSVRVLTWWLTHQRTSYVRAHRGQRVGAPAVYRKQYPQRFMSVMLVMKETHRPASQPLLRAM